MADLIFFIIVVLFVVYALYWVFAALGGHTLACIAMLIIVMYSSYKVSVWINEPDEKEVLKHTNRVLHI